MLLALTFLLDSVLAKRENAINEKVHYLEYSRHDFVHQCLMNYKEIKTLNLEKRMKREYVKWLHGWAKYNLIYLNNTVLKDYILPAQSGGLYFRMSVIRQDSLLLNMSVRENLLLGKYDAKEEELLEALKQAELLEYVSSLEEGLYSIVGENGIKLSGGQRQRLLLARMFLRNPDLYIFDEATSSLDHRTEEMLMESITRLPEDKLVFIITHRMPIVKICDRIYVIKDGKVEAAGRHDRLMEESTYYRGLYEKQQIS